MPGDTPRPTGCPARSDSPGRGAAPPVSGCGPRAGAQCSRQQGSPPRLRWGALSPPTDRNLTRVPTTVCGAGTRQVSGSISPWSAMACPRPCLVPGLPSARQPRWRITQPCERSRLVRVSSAPRYLYTAPGALRGSSPHAMFRATTPVNDRCGADSPLTTGASASAPPGRQL